MQEGDVTLHASEVRELIRSEHALLREMLDEIDALTAVFESGAAPEGEALRGKGAALYERFEKHLELEDRLLKPTLLRAGPAGERGARHLEHEHREQRELIRYLLGRLEKSRTPTLLIAREIRNFAEYLRLDMEHEERDLLADDILGAAPQAR